MRRALRIARREFIAAVCTKGFLIGLVLAPVMMCGGLIGVAVMQKQTGSTDRRLVVIDRSTKLADALTDAAARHNQTEGARPRPGSAYLLEVAPPNLQNPEQQRLALSDQIRAGQLHAFVEIGASVVHAAPGQTDSQVHYYARNPALDDIRGWVGNVVNERLRHLRLLEAGVDPAAVTNLFAWVPAEGMSLAARDARTGSVKGPERQNEAKALGVPMAVAMLTMLLVMMGSAPLLQSVMEEKSQRIAEVLLGAATPSEIMLGKLLGGVAVSVTAMTVYLTATFVALGSLAIADAVPLGLIPWFALFVISAIVMFGAVAAALGSACNDARDAQQLQLPIMLPIMIPMFLMLPVIKEPQSLFATLLSLFPPFTPLLMPMRMSTPGGIPGWQPWLGLAGVLGCALIALWLGGRIFRVGILMQGKLPKFAEILRWGFRG